MDNSQNNFKIQKFQNEIYSGQYLQVRKMTSNILEILQSNDKLK